VKEMLKGFPSEGVVGEKRPISTQRAQTQDSDEAMREFAQRMIRDSLQASLSSTAGVWKI